MHNLTKNYYIILLKGFKDSQIFRKTINFLIQIYLFKNWTFVNDKVKEKFLKYTLKEFNGEDSTNFATCKA